MSHISLRLSALVLALTSLFLAANWKDLSAEDQAALVVYCGRKKGLVEEVIKSFEVQHGVKVEVKYGKSTPLAKTIMEEGKNSPCDLFFSQDAGALGALSGKGLLAALPEEVLGRVDKRYRSVRGDWTGVSGRARVVCYNTKKLKPEDLPGDIWGFTDPKWKGRIGWPPSNASFQTFVTALRKTEGEAKAREWLTKILANEPRVYPKNTPAVDAVGRGEVDVAFVNHYYLFKFVTKNPEFAARNHYLTKGAGALVNVAGVGVLKSSDKAALANKLVAYLLSKPAQEYFVNKTFEYALVDDAKIAANPLIPAIGKIGTPDVPLNELDDLAGTVKLLRDLKILK